MISAFGVDHGLISKADEPKKRAIKPAQRLPHVAGNVLPASTVRAFDNSRKRKAEAATVNFASQAGGGLAGSATGIAGAIALANKKPGAFKAIKVGSKTIAPQYQKEALRLASAGGGGAIGSLIGSGGTSAYIHRSKRYKYKERGL